VSANITGLTAGTVYHFRIVATNSAGTRYGLDKTFAAVPLDRSVTWQNNPTHDGFDPASPLVPPLSLKWSRDFSASGVVSISYPLIAQGMVFVTTTTENNYGDTLVALNEHTGTTIWSANIPGTYYFANAAYDSGKVFVVNFDGLMKAFNAANGTLLWSVELPDQYAFTSPPTAANGIVFVGGAGSGGTVYAVNETNGEVLWTMPVENGDHSSPAVTLESVFVSYACPQAYAFNTLTGQELWHRSSCCEGGGGATPVVHGGQVYVRDDFCDPTTGLVLDANTGNPIGGFNSDTPPAFIGNLALYFQSGTLVGVDIPSGQQLWSFAGEGDLNMADLAGFSNDLDKTLTRHHFILFDGKHEWAPLATMDMAFAGLQLDAMRPKLTPGDDAFITRYIAASKKRVDAFYKASQLIKAADECKRSTSLLNGLTGEAGWFKTKAASLAGNPTYQEQRQAQENLLVTEQNTKTGYMQHFQQADMHYWTTTINDLQTRVHARTAESAMCQRLLAYLSLAFYSYSNHLINANANNEARYFVELYKIADPSNSEAWYFSAILSARNKQAQAAENDLIKAAGYGFRDKNRLLQQPEFQQLSPAIHFSAIENSMHTTVKDN